MTATIETLLDFVVQAGGSDLHLEQGQKPKTRIQGVIQDVKDCAAMGPEDIRACLDALIPPDLREKYFSEGREIDFGYSFADKARFRVNCFRHHHGLGAVMRLIPTQVLSLSQIKAPEVLKKFASLRKGMVLVTGPTGSGKSTTLAAMLDYVNDNFIRKIVTLEDPIEFIHTNKRSRIIQRAVRIDTPSFEQGLKDALRSDCDAVLIGELRDYESISLAITAANRGMLVFGTVHTNSTAKTIDRIVNVFPTAQQHQARSMLASSLAAVCAQMLLVGLDGKRVAAHEILISTPSLSNLIVQGETYKIESLIQTGHHLGMKLMDDAIADLLTAGLISRQEAYMKAMDKDRFEFHA